MTVQINNSHLLATLLTLDKIRAVLRVNKNGRLKARYGQAKILREIGTDDPTLVNVSNPTRGPGEAVYIFGFEGDFLVVVFDDDADFDALKSEVDALLAGA